MDEIAYITTPLYYVNAEPHIGHAYTQIAADTLARYCRQSGKKVFFLTGTDEHGQKIQDAADARGISPREHTDEMVGKFKDLWVKLDISNDGFIRTTDEEHKETVRSLLNKLYEKGEIEKRSYTGWYCVPDERFWREKDLEEGKCPECGREVERIREDNYFFLMSAYQEKLIEYINSNPGYIKPDIRRNEVLGFLKNNRLDDLCISRPKSRLSWGIPLPFDENYVTYVWFDALINYYSATGYIAPPGVNWWPATCHLIGKDILTTHSVYWSTMLMGLGLPLPRKIFAHGWWTITGEKMSKSRGNVIAPLDLVEQWGVNAFRYFLLRQVSFGMDGNFSEEQFISRYETDLANDLGNLLSRVLSMISKYSPSYDPSRPDGFEKLSEDISGDLEELYGELRFSSVLDRIWEIVKSANVYVERSAPWNLAKSDTERLSQVLTSLYETLGCVASLIYPFMPGASAEMNRQLGIEEPGLGIRRWGDAGRFGNIKKGDPLFPKK